MCQALCKVMNISNSQPLKVHLLMIPILQMNKLSFRKAKKESQKALGISQGGLCDSKVCAFSTIQHEM